MNHKVSAIIAAAGQGKRMNASINKQYLMLLDKPVLVHTLEVFEKCDLIDEIVIVAHKDEIDYCKKEIIEKYNFNKIKKVVAGGKERQESIFNGLNSLNEECDIVVVHDGARPFVKDEYIKNSIKETIKYKAVGVGVSVKDTIKVVDDNDFIINTPDRKTLWAIHTPQTFDYKLLLSAHKKALEDHYLGTDDTVLVERMNQKVKMIKGGYDNIKITTKEDIVMGEAILKSRRDI